MRKKLREILKKVTARDFLERNKYPEYLAINLDPITPSKLKRVEIDNIKAGLNAAI